MEDITTTVLDAQYVSFGRDGDIRSPRTPTWSPPTPSSPFEYDRFLSSTPSPPVSPKRFSLPPPPDNPLPWIWQCHLCRNRYALGVTRRCLYDGHYYCSGETGQPNLKKKKGKACSSEFDYEGWETYGDWRTRALQQVENGRTPRGCETCEFPSQCRTPALLMPVTKKDKKKDSVEKVVVVEPEQQQDKIVATLAAAKNIIDEMIIDPPSVPTNPKSKVDFDSILKDLMRDEEELSPKGATSKTGATSVQKRSKSKERIFSKNFGLSVEEDAKVREDVAQSLSDLVMPVFDILSGKSKSAKGKTT